MALHDFRNALRFVSPASNHPTENKVRFPHSASFLFGAGEFAFSLWVYPVLRSVNITDGLIQARYGILSMFQTGEGASSSSLYLWMQGAGGSPSSPSTTIDTLGIALRTIDSVGEIRNRFSSINNLSPRQNNWNNLVLQRSGNNLQCYFNGILGSSVALMASETIDTIFGFTHLLGAVEGSAGFNGYMDEFVIYNRSLSADEATGLYNNGLGNIPPMNAFDNIVSYWRFDQHSERTLVDYTPLYNNLYAPGSGTLLNYTDAQVAEGTQTVWVDHFTLVPSTLVIPVFAVTGTPAVVLDATFTAPQGTLMNAYMPEVGPQFVQAANWITGTCPPWAFDGAGRIFPTAAVSGGTYAFAAAPLNQAGMVRGVMEGMVYPAVMGRGFVLLSNAAGTDMIRCQVNRNGAAGALTLYIIFDYALQAYTFYFLEFTAADGGELICETDGSNVTVKYVQGGVVRAQMSRTAPSPYSGGHVGVFAGESIQNTISRFTVTKFT